jgi:predicted RNA-binding Zn-ribbon protein involved in translation (DUF1610 family)
MTTDSTFFSTKMGIFFLFLLVLGAIFIYLLPTIIGWNKKHKLGIFLINLLLGWTVLGWIGSLIWSVSSPKELYLPWVYTCQKCGFKRALDQKLKMYKCPQCGEEHIINN